MWGIKAHETVSTGKRGLGIAPVDDDAITPVFDISVRLDSPASQAAIVETCRRLIGAKTLVRGGVKCPMLEFSQWRTERKLAFPLPQTEFPAAFGDYLRNGNLDQRDTVLFDEGSGRLMAMFGEFESVLDTNNQCVKRAVFRDPIVYSLENVVISMSELCVCVLCLCGCVLGAGTTK